MSLAARQLNESRWGSQKAMRLARELEPRVDELPADRRDRLLAALATAKRKQEQEKPWTA